MKLKRLAALLLTVCMLIPCFAFGVDAEQYISINAIEEPSWYCGELEYGIYDGYPGYPANMVFNRGNYWATEFSWFKLQDGRIGYCVQPNKPGATGSYVQNPASWDSLTMPRQEGVGLAFLYGAPNNGKNSQADYVATAAVVRDMACGYRMRDTSFCINGDNGSAFAYSPFGEKLRTNYPEAYAIYNQLLADIARHGTVPSFASKSRYEIGIGQTISLKYNASSGLWEGSATDTNGVLQHFDYISNIPGLTFTKEGNTLYVTATKQAAAQLTNGYVASGMGFEFDDPKDVCTVWTKDASVSDGGATQLIAVMDAATDPVPTYFKLVAEDVDADVNVVKTSDDGKVDGITFTVKNNTTGANGTYTTANGGKFSFKAAIGDSVTITENVPAGYYNIAASQTITAVGGVNTVAFHNSLNRGNLTVSKDSEDGIVSGVKFRIYGNCTAGFFVDETVTTNGSGQATFSNVPVGTYTLHEVDVPERYLTPNVQSVSITAGSTATASFTNTLKRWYVTVTKVDAETGAAIPQSGAGFQIYNPSGSLVTMGGKNTFYTDANGSFTTPEPLPYGKGYSLVEVAAPTGYALDSTPVVFDVTDATATGSGSAATVKVTKANPTQKGIIRISKSGEVFASVTENEGVYQPQYAEAPLAGAVFEIRAAEEIKTPGGTLVYSTGDLVATVTTDEAGATATKELPLGKYTVTEITAPTGMSIYPMSKTVELTYDDKAQSVIYADVTFVNQRQKAVFALEKVLEADTDFSIVPGTEITSVKFGLYAAEAMTAADGSAIPADGLLETAACDADGKITFATDLPYGAKVYVQEIATDEKYILSDEKYPAAFPELTQDVVKVDVPINNGEPIQNELIRGTISCKKIDEDGCEICGAKFGLFAADETIFTEGTAIKTSVSNEIGVFGWEDIPYGSYVVRELKAAPAFVLNETSYPVTIDEDGETVELTVENKFITGSVTTTKVDSEFPETKLPGAVFAVYVDADGNKEFDSTVDLLVGNLEETETGVYVMEDLRYNGYFLHEEEAPANFRRDDTYYYFEIRKNGEIVTVENKEGVGFVNEPMVGRFEITKTDVTNGNPLPNAGFRIRNEAGEVILEGYTDNNGIATFGNLRIGKYTYEEFTAPKGYVLNTTKYPFEIKEDGEIVKATMTNPPIPKTPATGDTSNIGLWSAAVIVSAAAVSVILLFRKRKSKGV